MWFLLQQYTLAKVRQEIEPLTAQETLRRQNLLNSKLAAYRNACAVVCQSLASQAWKGSGVPDGRQVSRAKPSEESINTCAADLALFSGDPRVRNSFMKCFQSPSAADLGTFIAVLREDLGYGKSHFDPTEYPYFFGSSE